MKNKRPSIVPGPSLIRTFSSPVHSEGHSSSSSMGFRHWHKRMQEEHEEKGRPGFGLWKWCFTTCTPCRKFDSIDYNKNLCKCCFKFKTFKSLGTIVLIVGFIYVFLFSIFKDQLLPGGTLFFLFLLITSAYIMGILGMYAGLPPMFGNLLVGIALGNFPPNWLPSYDESLFAFASKSLEKALLLIALVRAGLLLDLSRIKSRVQFIIRMSICPLMCEFIFVFIATRFMLELPWEWSALQGSVLCIVSLASVTSIMMKNKQSGYGEDKHLSTVLIAASAMDLVVGIFLYTICISYIFPTDNIVKEPVWGTILSVLKETSLGLSVGIVTGLLAAFFPDKHHPDAAALRILVIGCGALAIAGILTEYNMVAGGVLGTLTMCLIASNMWEELGWHEASNPVQYFYSMAYYFGQPVGISLIGFSMNFTKSTAKEIGWAVLLIIIGLTARECMCYISTLGSAYPTTVKEKLFICIAWLSKGTFQALLAAAVGYMILDSDLDEKKKKVYSTYARIITQTTILAILLTTPLATYSLTVLTPILLTKNPENEDRGEKTKGKSVDLESGNVTRGRTDRTKST